MAKQTKKATGTKRASSTNKLHKSTRSKSKGSDVEGKRGPKKKAGRTRRDAAKYPGLNKSYFSRIKQEYHDIDYVNKLSEEEKEWLSSFMEEDLGARFNHKRKKIYKKVGDKRASYRRNNYRNMDIYSNSKAANRLIDIAPDKAFELWQDRYNDASYEDRLIEGIEGGQSFEEDSTDIKKK